ncbi:hypothetical protein TRIP_C60386 [Candidatus Zixiibacteriota bacterium]|nr:hypothetical protein TRIP_C60386 [candidate division Zixibacteria bacterium]
MPPKIDVAGEITRNNELMALPQAVMRVLESAAKDEISIDSISDIIGEDPALTGRLLKIANSPFYGLSHKVNSINQAVMLLGLTTVKCLALSAALFSKDNPKNSVGIDVPALYSNLISVAVTCRKLAMACNYKAPENAFTCGLLHEIGLLYFLHHHPAEYRMALAEASKTGSILEAEKKVFGATHPEAGSLIAARWRLPNEIASAIGHHHFPGRQEISRLDEILLLAVALNHEILPVGQSYIEDKIAKISVLSKKLNISDDHLNDIAQSIPKEVSAFARSTDIEVENIETVLARANQELFATFISIQRLFKERQELTRKILDEERERGLLEAKQVAISTLSHYINNASMAISGNAQVIRMSLKHKTPAELAEMLPRMLDIIDHSVHKIVAVLEEISDLNSLDSIEFYDQSKILNIDDRLERRLARLQKDSGIVLPAEAEKGIKDLAS